jgi:type I restriction-modification system DNA methylase subunit
VIPLPPRLSKGDRTLSSILILSNKKPPAQKHRVSFIYPARISGGDSPLEGFSGEGIDEIASALNDSCESGPSGASASYVALMARDELERYSYNLDPKRYDLPSHSISSAQLAEPLDRLIEERNSLERRVLELLDELRPAAKTGR